MEPEEIAKAEDQARRFFDGIRDFRKSTGAQISSQSYILGDKPTALDAHAIVFIARLVDVDRQDLVPQEWLEYHEHHTHDAPWKGVSEGRPTIVKYIPKQQ